MSRLRRETGVPSFDLPKHDLYVGGGELISGAISNNAQLGLHGSMVIAPCLTQCLSNPLGKGHPLSAGNGLKLPVLFLIYENL